MKLYVYADESGTFDKAHNDLFVYGGIVVPGTETKKNVERLYASVEDDIRSHSSVFDSSTELKACFLGMKERKRLFGVIEHSECFQFGVIVDQSRIYDGIYSSKGSKQRYQDWALKMGIRQCVCTMLKWGQCRSQISFDLMWWSMSTPRRPQVDTTCANQSMRNFVVGHIVRYTVRSTSQYSHRAFPRLR